MRIIVLTQVLPFPRDAGPKVRAYYVLKYLAERHDVTLVSFVRPSDSQLNIDHLRQICEEVHTVPMPRSKVRDVFHLANSLRTDRPWLIVRDWVPAMAELLRKLVNCGKPFDAVHADQLWMAPYALWAKQAVTGSKPLTLVLDQHNAVFLIPGRMAEAQHNPLMRMLLAHESKKMARYEAAMCRQFEDVVWVTEQDYTAVKSINLEAARALPNAGLIPICVDPVKEPIIQRDSRARRVTFLGGLHYPPNAQGLRWYAEHVFPMVLEQAPDAVLTVIGKQPPKLHDLGLLDANLDVTGYVDDPKPYLRETGAFIVPIHAAGGMRVKILEAWMWGLPMVSTSIGAEGIRLLPGENLLIGDTPETFAAATIQLLRDPDLGDRLAKAGRAWVQEHYAWQNVYRRWDKVYAPEHIER